MIEFVSLFEQDQAGSLAHVTIGEQVVPVYFWYSIKQTLEGGDDVFEAYLKSQAYYQLGMIDEAVAELEPYASGGFVEETHEYPYMDEIVSITQTVDRRNIPALLIAQYRA